MPKNSSNDSVNLLDLFAAGSIYKLVHFQVSERRLRPIYDWLDNGNNKKALQEADKVSI